ncbi:alpha/beta knot [Myriangium duriaei CBS 260.36]|uniref:Alpha/beta knot n=1 Tax=Myriangium duriaei CBS 260.36 TaxID=1168546 RepID=A0A9P4IXJ8_9PEZI|nr:alpha/beta knot [Myriangium duriaei CBS 260.36]
MDIASGYRPHQGILLEVSPLPFPPVRSMLKPPYTNDNAPLQFQVEDQQVEERQINNRLSTVVSPDPSRWRKPVVLLLDGIKDEGNMGNIIRTAYFYNVDAVAICVNTCAPISSPIVAKAASGALEAMPLLRLNKPTDFLRQSQYNTWKVWASVPPGKGPENQQFQPEGRRQKASTQPSPPMIRRTSTMQSPLVDAPAILMLGSEGEGLRDIMLARADGRVSIDPPGNDDRRRDLGIDSMNVASAAAVLLEAFMRKPLDHHLAQSTQTPVSAAETTSTAQSETTTRKPEQKQGSQAMESMPWDSVLG